MVPLRACGGIREIVRNGNPHLLLLVIKPMINHLKRLCSCSDKARVFRIKNVFAYYICSYNVTSAVFSIPGPLHLGHEPCLPHDSDDHQGESRVSAADGKKPADKRQAPVQSSCVTVVKVHGASRLRPNVTILKCMAYLTGKH